MKTLSFICLCFLFTRSTSWASEQNSKSWIGKLRSQLPKDATWEDGNELDSLYMWDRRKSKNGSVLVFEKLEKTDKKNEDSSWRVLDVMPYPSSDDDKEKRVAVGSCKDNHGRFDPEIIALIAYEKDLEKTKQAWRMSRRTGKFEHLSASGITCPETASD